MPWPDSMVKRRCPTCSFLHLATHTTVLTTSCEVETDTLAHCAKFLSDTVLLQIVCTRLDMALSTVDTLATKYASLNEYSPGYERGLTGDDSCHTQRDVYSSGQARPHTTYNDRHTTMRTTSIRAKRMHRDSVLFGFIFMLILLLVRL